MAEQNPTPIFLAGGEMGERILRHELADNLPLVAGDRVQLQQVIMNLLRNAVDAMSTIEDRSRQLMIKTESDDGLNVHLIVQDAGIGFAPDVVDGTSNRSTQPKTMAWVSGSLMDQWIPKYTRRYEAISGLWLLGCSKKELSGIVDAQGD